MRKRNKTQESKQEHKAKALIKSTDMNLKDISDILNFCTPSHFGRFFKRYTG